MNDNTFKHRLKILINNFNNKNFSQTITLAKQLLKIAPKQEAYLQNTCVQQV